MTRVVLDASALLASLRGEPGADRIDTVITGAQMSAVNLAEVVQKLVADGATDEAVRAIVDGLACKIEPFDAAMGVQTGLLRRATGRRGLSLGDRACLALALRLGLPAMTADRAWADVDAGVEVVLIR